MSIDFNDWSTHIMQAEIQIKGAEHALLHKNYDKVPQHIHAAKAALDKALAWLTTQGSNAGVDIVPALEKLLDSTPDPSRPYIMAAIQEIKQLLGERQFWLKSGYEIGSAEQK